MKASENQVKICWYICIAVCFSSVASCVSVCEYARLKYSHNPYNECGEK